MAYRAGH